MMVTQASDRRAPWMRVPAILALAAAAYAPALNNGFISDDYIILSRVDLWLSDFSQITMPPEGIRLTNYAFFALVRTLVGYRPFWYYACAILLHLLNVVLLWHLVRRPSNSEIVAASAALFFAVVQNPQEAVWWLAAIGDTLVGTFVLAALIAWNSERFLWGTAFAAAAMVSKDSGLVLLVLIPLLDSLTFGRLRMRRQYALLLLPAAGYFALFAATARTNSYLTSELYAFHPRAILTLLNTLHRLAFPWLYIAAAVALASKAWRRSRELAVPPAWMAAALLPYSFITYQNHVPSRGKYLAAMGSCWLIAVLLGRVPSREIEAGFMAAFVVVNAGYLWIVKDRQYKLRAAPTEALLLELHRRTPGCLAVQGFPLNPWIAKDTAPLVRGWHPNVVRVNEPVQGECIRLRWDPAENRYASAGGSR